MEEGDGWGWGEVSIITSGRNFTFSISACEDTSEKFG